MILLSTGKMEQNNELRDQQGQGKDSCTRTLLFELLVSDFCFVANHE